MVTFQGKQYADWREARSAMVTPKQDDAGPAVEVAEPEPMSEAAPLLAPTPAPARRAQLTERHRPRRLCEIVGQSAVVAQLAGIVAAPYPCSLLLAGETGTGKTSAAWALAGDLGCDLDAVPVEFGGVHNIASGEHTAESLRTTWPALWTMPFCGSGWKVLIVNEVEQLSSSVEKLWLDKLEDLPPSTVVVFTTNDLAGLPARFVDRCGLVLEFESAADRLADDARALARRVWQDETGGELPADVLQKVMARATSGGRLSFRRVVQAIVPLLAQRGR